jgi:prepilin-type N-terminal cleavage/methylation domain-containing protein
MEAWETSEFRPKLKIQKMKKTKPRPKVKNSFPVLLSRFAFLNFNFEFKKGFTLLETIIVISIIVLVGAGAMASFVNTRNIRDLTTSGQNVLSVLRLAQTKAIAGEDNDTWGVRLEQGRFILFAGSAFAGSPTTTVYDLSANIEIANINLIGGGQEVVFEKIDGRTDETGTFDLRVRGSTGTTYPITVDVSGKVYQTGTAPSILGTRIIDTRHRDFNLGWSLQGYSTMTLTFSDPPNPDIVENVTTSSFFNLMQTEYDWSGTVVVGGDDQVHTAFLDSVNTILSVDRDCRLNSKQLKITFDSRDIATYSADCQSVTVEAYGGTISEP